MKTTSKKIKNKDDLKKIKMKTTSKKLKNKDDFKKKQKKEDDLRKKSTLIGCDIIVN